LVISSLSYVLIVISDSIFSSHNRNSRFNKVTPSIAAVIPQGYKSNPFNSV